MSYGAGLENSHRLTGSYTGRTLKGEKFADLCIRDLRSFDLSCLLSAHGFSRHSWPNLLELLRRHHRIPAAGLERVILFWISDEVLCLAALLNSLHRLA